MRFKILQYTCLVINGMPNSHNQWEMSNKIYITKSYSFKGSRVASAGAEDVCCALGKVAGALVEEVKRLGLVVSLPLLNFNKSKNGENMASKTMAVMKNKSQNMAKYHNPNCLLCESWGELVGLLSVKRLEDLGAFVSALCWS